jgi:transposase-like protein
MGDFARKSDGRRIFTVEFKRGIAQQLVKGEKTLAEVSRELDIQPSVIREWKRRVEAGATTAVAANEDVVPASVLREAQQRIRELERLLGRKGQPRREQGFTYPTRPPILALRPLRRCRRAFPGGRPCVLQLRISDWRPESCTDRQRSRAFQHW